MKKLILAAALAALTGSALADGWTVHTRSMHFGVDGLNNNNPGLAYDVRPDVRVGALYNSYKKPSLYAAKIIPLNRYMRVGLGVITGYTWRDGDIHGKTTGILPLLAVEADLAPNISVIWLGQAINLEVKF